MKLDLFLYWGTMFPKGTVNMAGFQTELQWDRTGPWVCWASMTCGPPDTPETKDELRKLWEFNSSGFCVCVCMCVIRVWTQDLAIVRQALYTLPLKPCPQPYFYFRFFLVGGGTGVWTQALCKAGNLLLEPHLQPSLIWLFWRCGSLNHLPQLALNYKPPDLSLPSS
jgi:hypothetical protein